MTATPPPEDPADRVIIPGQRVGPITVQTRRDDLTALYGEAALSDRPVHVGEGFTEPGTVIHADSERQVAVVWAIATEGGESLAPGDRYPLMVRDFGAAWQTPEGLRVGAPYDTVRQALGRFQLYGFAWDYGGTVVLTDTQLRQYDGYLWLRMAPSEAAIARHADAFQATLGDDLFDSDDPRIAALAPSVYEMVVSFDREGQSLADAHVR